MMTLNQASATVLDLMEGRLTSVAALLAAYDDMVASKAGIVAELNKLTKKALAKRISGHVWSDDKKADLVEKAWDTLVFGLNPATSWSMSLGTREPIESIIRRHIEKATDASIAAYSAEALQRRADYLEKVKAKLAEIRAEKEANG